LNFFINFNSASL